MELRQLVYFDAVVRHSGFTRAAEHLHVAQSAISAQVRQLEAELGVQLLNRTTRRVSLTVEGERFLARTRRILDELDAARRELDERAALLHGRVVLGATPVLGPLNLPEILAKFRTRHPGVELELRYGLITELLAALDAGETEFVLGPVHSDLASRFSARHLVDEELVIITSSRHRLAQAAKVALVDIRDEAFICLPRDSGLRQILDTAGRSSGFVPNVPIETSSPTDIRNLVSSGLGVAIVARSMAETTGAPVAVHTIAPPGLHTSIGLIQHRDHRLTPAARACRLHVLHGV